MLPKHAFSFNVTAVFKRTLSVYLFSRPKSSFLPSYIIDVRELDEKLLNIIDMKFLHGYYEPTLLILFEPNQTWPGLVRTDSVLSGERKKKYENESPNICLVFCPSQVCIWKHCIGNLVLIWVSKQPLLSELSLLLYAFFSPGVWLSVRTLAALLQSPSTSCRRFILSSGLSVICPLIVHRSWLSPNPSVSSEEACQCSVGYEFALSECWSHLKRLQVVWWCLLWIRCSIWTRAFLPTESRSILRQMGPQPFLCVRLIISNPRLYVYLWVCCDAHHSIPCLGCAGVQDEVKLTLDCCQSDFIAYDKMVISLKGGEMWVIVTLPAACMQMLMTLNYFLLAAAVLQLRVDTDNWRHEERARFPLWQSCCQRPDDLRKSCLWLWAVMIWWYRSSVS